MLNFIREHAQGWVVWVIVGGVCATFALFGVNSYMNGPTGVTVAKINGEKIGQAEYQRALQQYRDQMRAQLGDDFDPALFNSIDIKKSVLDGLVDRKLLQVVNHDLGQRVSDKSIALNIQSVPAFQKEGQFDADTYNRVLARSGLSASGFEAQLRSDMLSQEIVNNVQQSTWVGDYVFENVLRLEGQVREIAYGILNAQQISSEIIVEEGTVQEYYDKHKNNYQAPEQVSINYIELSIDELAEQQSEPDDVTLEQFYDDNEGQFIGPEQRKISHIMLEGDEQQATEALKIINSRLEQGELFSTLAAEFSQDTGSIADGGDLGLFQRKNIELAFETAVFDEMTVGAVSELIKSEFGFHVLKLTDIKAGEGKSFSDARSEIITLYQRQQAEQTFYEKAELLADLSYENPDDLLTASKELELEVKTSKSFTRNGGSGIASEGKVVAAAFSEDVLANNLNSGVIEINKSHLAVVHIQSHTETSQLPFDSVAPAIREQLRYELAADAVRVKGEAIIEKLKAGESPLELFEGGAWQTKQLVKRADKGVNRQVLVKAFSAPKPESEDQFTGFTANNGNYIIVQLSGVLEGDAIPEEYSESNGEGLKPYLAKIYGESELQAFVSSLRETAEIEVFEQFL